MFRLKVITGPNAGKSFTLQPGESSIGRQKGNTIVIVSNNVSKKHCAVIVEGPDDVRVRDLESANGTFVNGVLTRDKRIRVGDRIGIGDVVLELKSQVQQQSPRVSTGDLRGLVGGGNVFPFPGGNRLPLAVGGNPFGTPAPMGSVQGYVAPAPAPTIQVPTDLKGKVLFHFENYVMPFFYSMNLKQEWKSVAMMVFGAFLVLNMFIAVYPLVDSNRKTVMKETARRARFIARQLAERNGPALAAGAESRVDIGSVEREEGVSAYLVDLESRILAPASRSNQFLVSGPEATFAVRMGKKFKAGQESGTVGYSGGTVAMAVEPVKAFDSKTARNVVIAMAVVAVDASLTLPGAGGLSLIFSESFILSVFLGALAMLILYRLTLKPFEILNDDIDRALKGEAPQVTHEFKNEDLNSLWDVIRSAIQRIPRGSGVGTEDSLMNQGMTAQDIEPAFRFLVEGGDRGIVLCDKDRKVLMVNETFEDVSGIRGSEASGQDFVSVARDQAFSSLLGDLFEKIEMGGSAKDDFEFQGTAHKIEAMAFGPISNRAYLFLVTKGGD